MTAQFSDSIIYKGEQYGIDCEPLEPYLKTRPDIKYDGYCSACWRGYIAKWEVIEDKLYLIGLHEFKFGKEEPIIKEKTYNFNDIFPEQDKVFAEWFSGELKIHQGELLHYIHAVYASIYEREVILVIEKGVVVNEIEVDNRGKVFEEENVIKLMAKDLKKQSMGQRVKMFLQKRGEEINNIRLLFYKLFKISFLIFSLIFFDFINFCLYSTGSLSI